MNHFVPNPALDLVLERIIAVSPEQVWQHGPSRSC